MPNSTTRLGLQQPVITPTSDPPSALRSAEAVNTGILDGAVTITSGLLASLPTAGLYEGKTYYATDAGLWLFYNGSSWQAVPLAGGWVNLTLGVGVFTIGSPWPAPQARLVGDMVFFRGGALLTSSNTGVIATVPSAAYIPAGNRGIWCSQVPSGGIPISGYVDTSGNLNLPTAASSGMELDLSSVYYAPAA